MPLTDAERAYVGTQFLGRLATIDSKGVPQNNPVGVRFNEELGTFDIGGHDLANSRKFKNIQANPNVSLVIDDLESVQPWKVRGIEIRGRAEAIQGVTPEHEHFSAELIRVHPQRIISWGVDPEVPGMQRRSVASG
jgi:pyridoxamine 5'-phosphate oxidase family protein